MRLLFAWIFLLWFLIRWMIQNLKITLALFAAGTAINAFEAVREHWSEWHVSFRWIGIAAALAIGVGALIMREVNKPSDSTFRREDEDPAARRQRDFVDRL